MPPKPDRSGLQPLRDVVVRIDRIESYLQDVTEEAWGVGRQLRDAVERNLEVIGEALRRVRDTAPHLVDLHKESRSIHINVYLRTNYPMPRKASSARTSSRLHASCPQAMATRWMGLS